MIWPKTTLVALLGGGMLACATHASQYAIQWDSRNEILLADASQVKIRVAQSRTLDTTDRKGVLQAVTTTLQDLDFQVGVMDEVLGIVSGTKLVHGGKNSSTDPFYWQYNDDSLIFLSKIYHTWGPFNHRADLVRLTVTVRRRNSEQLLVRAAAQASLSPIEDPEIYQNFFASVEHALFAEQHFAED